MTCHWFRNSRGCDDMSCMVWKLTKVPSGQLRSWTQRLRGTRRVTTDAKLPKSSGIERDNKITIKCTAWNLRHICFSDSESILCGRQLVLPDRSLFSFLESLMRSSNFTWEACMKSCGSHRGKTLLSVPAFWKHCSKILDTKEKTFQSWVTMFWHPKIMKN